MEQVMEPKGWRLAGARVGGNKKGRVREWGEELGEVGYSKPETKHCLNRFLHKETDSKSDLEKEPEVKQESEQNKNGRLQNTGSKIRLKNERGPCFVIVISSSYVSQRPVRSLD